MFGHILWLVLGVPSVKAMDVGLDPQNRIHLGVNLVDGPSPVGIAGGFDSRLTRLVSLDIGGFASPVPIAEDAQVDVVEYADNLRLRHGIYVAPGLRVPHPQPKSVTYDFFGRLGAGVVWSANMDLPGIESSNFSVNPAPAGLVGADALVRVGRVGLRVSGKAWMYQGVRLSPEDSFFMLRPQGSIEGLYQW